tara:strand:+ start:1157 stop:2125 length:969 start_codon:yes stop_codon:yes gene_type:complete
MQVTLEEVLNYLAKRSVVKNTTSLQEQRDGEDIKIEDTVIKFPNLKVTERYYGQVRKGELLVEDRNILSKYVRNMGTDFNSRLDTLNQYAKGGAVSTEPSQIISAILLLDLLTAMVRQFTPSVSGFLFEAFAAAMFEGVQIETAGSNTVLADIMSNIDTETGESTNRSQPYSLKLLRDKGVVTGSQALLKRSWEQFGRMTYIVVNKVGDGEGLVFYKFTLTPEDTPIGGAVVKSAGTKFRVNYGYYKNTPGLKMGELHLGNSREMAQKYADVLGEQIKTIYNSLHDLGKNLESYFIENNKSAAETASQNAASLKQSIAKLQK